MLEIQRDCWGQEGGCWKFSVTFGAKLGTKTDPKSIRNRSFEVSKNKLNIEGSQDRFLMDFAPKIDAVKAPEEQKYIGKRNAGANCYFFDSLKINWLLDPKK